MDLDVVTIGQCIVDIFVKPVESLPPLGRAFPMEQVHLFPGGCAVNTALAVARLGGSAAVLGKVGTDPLAAFLKTALTQQHVHVGGLVETTEAATAACLLLIAAGGERRALLHYGAMATYHPGEVDRALLHRARAVHVGGIYHTPHLLGAPLAEILSDARAHHQLVSLDTQYNWRGHHVDALEAMLPHVDYLFVCMEEATELAGTLDVHRIGRFFLGMGVDTVIMKNGPEGAHLYNARQELYVPAYHVDVQDTTGAGDCFAAAFLMSLLRGGPAAQSARFAAAAAACCVTTPGPTTGLRSFQETEAFMWAHPTRA